MGNKKHNAESNHSNGKLREIIYARYSSDNQTENSIEGQLRECKAFAENKNGTRPKSWAC